MLRRTKSSSLLPLVRYFYPETSEVKVEELGVREVYPHGSLTGSLTPPPDYEQLYQSMQLDAIDVGEERVRRKYACQGSPPLQSCNDCLGLRLVASALAEDTSAISSNEVGFSKDLYVNGVEYILRGLPGTFVPLTLYHLPPC